MVKVSGEYRILLDGQVVSESKNVVTTSGSSTIRQFLAGSVSSWAEAIGIGSISTAATTADTKLAYEYNRQPVISKFLNGDATPKIVLRAAFPVGLTCKVNEIGVFPSINASMVGLNQDIMMTDFSEVVGAGGWSTGTGVSSVTGNSTVGASNLQLATAGAGNVASTLSSLSYQISGVTTTDFLDVLVYNNGASAKTFNISITDGTTTNNFNTNTTTTTAGLQVVSIALTNLTISSISSITITNTTATGTIEFDSMKFRSVDTSGLPSQIVSRTVLGTAITKVAGQDMEIEYILTVA